MNPTLQGTALAYGTSTISINGSDRPEDWGALASTRKSNLFHPRVGTYSTTRFKISVFAGFTGLVDFQEFGQESATVSKLVDSRENRFGEEILPHSDPMGIRSNKTVRGVTASIGRGRLDVMLFHPLCVPFLPTWTRPRNTITWREPVEPSVKAGLFEMERL